ncbi:hypothetical protein HAZT_HAZT006466 [Hyalella azteca]|uniref:Calcineurin-like phosphoesterase domain-containing protein n=1 Tax=Hyalella azteca TaxID=294128 RepID=A0A6A0GW28_HYAAZ|nr:hypothetical protein HAZT_HAZT006466 [Hyalella azteca]
MTHKHKVVIAGNHELTFDVELTAPRNMHGRSRQADRPVDSILQVDHLQKNIETENGHEHPSALLTNATYLQDSLITIAGVKIYGSPWQPTYMSMAFNLPRGAACLDKWDAIPAGVDVLLTHSPPLGHGDFCVTDVRAGCVELLSTVQQRVKPKYHVFGHIHEGYGITTDGQIIFINASTCNVNYLPCNPPLVFDVPIPQGYSK